MQRYHALRMHVNAQQLRSGKNDTQESNGNGKGKIVKAGEWTIKGEDLSKAFTLQRKSIKPADLDDYNAYAKRLQSKMGISSQLTTNSTDISGMFELPEGETNKNHFDTLPPLK